MNHYKAKYTILVRAIWTFCVIMLFSNANAYSQINNATVSGLGSKQLLIRNITTETPSGASANINLSGVFSSIPIPIKVLPSSTNWNMVYPSIEQAHFSSCARSGKCTASAKHMAQIVKEAQSLSFSSKLSFINSEVNNLITYTSDQENYGVLDFWASPSQTLARGMGDCEDYVILKMSALSVSGIPLNSMSIVVLQDTRREVFHAVLAVATSQGHYILDNLNNTVQLDTAYKNYLPLYSLSGNRSWLHGRPRNEGYVASKEFHPKHFLPGVEFSTIKTTFN